jgi:NinB protein
MKRLILTGEAARKAACREVLAAPDGWSVVIKEPTRSLEANAAMWPILDAFAKQVKWPVNGAMQLISPEDWKDILTAAFRQHQPRVAQGLDGGMVILGLRTSKFSKRTFSDWLDFLNATAIDKGVVL